MTKQIQKLAAKDALKQFKDKRLVLTKKDANEIQTCN